MDFQLLENYVKRATTIVLLGALSFASIEAGLLLRQSRKDEIILTQQTSKVLTETSSTLADTRRTVEIVSGTANQVRHIAEEERKQSATQARLINQDLAKLGGVLDTTNGAIQAQNLQLQNLETQSSVALIGTETQIDQTFDMLQPAIQSLADAAPIVAQNAVTTTNQIAEIAQHTNVTSQNIQDATTDLKNYIHRMTTPVRGVWNAIKGMIEGFGGPAAGAVTAARTH